MVKLCLIGLGNFGRILDRKIGEINGLEITHYYHSDKIKAKKFNSEKGTSDLKSALKDTDGVIIATPNNAHAKNIKECFKARKHIFVEKPLTGFYKDALELKQILPNGPVFMVGHNQRREGWVREAKRILVQNKLGKIVSVYFNVSHGGAFSFNPKQWRYNLKSHREGPLITLGIHLMDTAHYLFGRVDSVYARIGNISGKTEAPDCNAVVLGLKNGASVFLQANYNMPSEEIFVIHGTEGTIYINRGKLLLRMGRDRRINNQFVVSKPLPIKLRKVDSIKEELEEFRDAILGKKKAEAGFKEGLNALALIEACHQSNKKNKIIFMKDFKNYRI